MRGARRWTAVRLAWAAAMLAVSVLLAGAGCGAPGELAAIEARVVEDVADTSCSGSPFRAHLRVMPVGDSLTAGNLAGSSWRAPLLAALNERPDLQTVEFVGAHSIVAPCCYEGFPGANTAQVATRFNGQPRNDLATYPADVVLVMLGTNDQAPEAVPGYMSGIIDTMLATPGVVLIAAPVPYWGPDDARRLAFNAALLSALRAHPAFGGRLRVAEAMADILAPGDDYLQATGQNDAVHPGPVGNAKIASVWRAAGANVAWPAVSP